MSDSISFVQVLFQILTCDWVFDFALDILFALREEIFSPSFMDKKIIWSSGLKEMLRWYDNLYQRMETWQDFI